VRVKVSRVSWRAKNEKPVPEEASEEPAADDAVAKRLAELTHREVALRKVTEVVEQQRTRLEERERALERSSSDLEKQLAEAVRRAERADQRVRELEQKSAAQPKPRPAETVVIAPPPPVPRPVSDEPPSAESTYTLQRLERLVHEAQLRGDPQAEEWAYYLPLLREHAEPDGRLPAQFAALVDSIFEA
jgi:septal ring factor EnvC (AmiA/AmiB activator)